MRNANFTVNAEKVVQQSITISKEEFIRIIEDKLDGSITCVINMYEGDTFVESNMFFIGGDKYALLMSESPEFAPGKPVNEYREIDLWHIIDLIRSGQ